MATTAQPGARGEHLNYTGEWSTGTFECCSDFKTLLCACCCTPCFLCDLDKDAGECPLTTICCGCFSMAMLRGKLRGHYKIGGDIWKDILCLECCTICTLIQMKNELVRHGVD